MIDRGAVGRRGEELACEHLRKKGYRIVERNVRSRYGEIDIVATHDDCLVFVEVRTVQSVMMKPEESIGPRKQRRMGALAMRYVQGSKNPDVDWRTDVVAIELDEKGSPRRVEHIMNAVEEH